MAEAFSSVLDAQLDAHGRTARREVHESFDAIRQMFRLIHDSPVRSIEATSAQRAAAKLAYELAALYALRLIELTRGVDAVVRDNNPVAALPLLRSVYEVWFAIAYTAEALDLATEKDQPLIFVDHGKRLLFGRSKSEERVFYIKSGKLLAKAKKRLSDMADDADTRQKLGTKIQVSWDTLCDGTHPTHWSLMPHLDDSMDDQDATKWLEEARFGADFALTTLNIPLRIARVWLADLVRSADRLIA